MRRADGHWSHPIDVVVQEECSLGVCSQRVQTTRSGGRCTWAVRSAAPPPPSSARAHMSETTSNLANANSHLCDGRARSHGTCAGKRRRRHPRPGGRTPLRAPCAPALGALVADAVYAVYAVYAISSLDTDPSLRHGTQTVCHTTHSKKSLFQHSPPCVGLRLCCLRNKLARHWFPPSHHTRTMQLRRDPWELPGSRPAFIWDSRQHGASRGIHLARAPLVAHTWPPPPACPSSPCPLPVRTVAAASSSLTPHFRPGHASAGLWDRELPAQSNPLLAADHPTDTHVFLWHSLRL